MGVGALGGLFAFVFARILAEPLIQSAIDYEEARGEAEAALAMATGAGHAHAEGPEVFSRVVQAGVGIGSGMVLFGVAMGGFFAAAYCTAYGRTGRIRPRPLALLVAAAGFLTLYLVPFLKYPANPPAVGNDLTVATRAGLYGVMVIASVVLAVAAVWVGQRLAPRFGNGTATLLAGLGFVVAVGVVMALLPGLGDPVGAAGGRTLSETPQALLDPAGRMVFPGFDADLLYWYRLYSVGAQAVLWAVVGFAFAPLADRVFARHGHPTQQDMAASTG
jgi:hypothetical protein